MSSDVLSLLGQRARVGRFAPLTIRTSLDSATIVAILFVQRPILRARFLAPVK